MPQTLKQFLERLGKEKAPGPTPSFTPFHLILTVEHIEEKTVGRTKLAEELGIGEGVARTLIGRLKNAGLISTSKAGCSLTKRGLELWKEYQATLRKIRIEKNELTFGNHNFAVLVRNSGHKVKTGIEQRDAAVKAGAKSATTILYKNESLTFPSPDRNMKRDFPKASTQIANLLKPQENDVIIIVSSDSLEKAEYGALAAAWTLLDSNQ